MKMIRLFSSCVLLMSACNFVFAKQYIGGGSLALGTFNVCSRAERVIVAKDLLEKIIAFDSFVATSTPSEINWINIEKKEIKNNIPSQRYLNLVTSSEYQQYQLKQYLKMLRYAIKNIIIADDISSEMRWWTYTGVLLINSTILNDAIPILKRNKKIPNNIEEKKVWLDDGVTGYNTSFHITGLGILQYITLPYLGGENLNKN